jgi:hypothetical protein
MTTARYEVQVFIWLVTLPVVDIMEHEYNWIEFGKSAFICIENQIKCYTVKNLKNHVILVDY